MEERISTLLKGQQFFDLGVVIFASNHPDHVYLLEVKNEDDDGQIYTVLYDKKHDYLNIHKRINIIDENNPEDLHDMNVELTSEQQVEIKQLLEESGNNVLVNTPERTSENLDDVPEGE